MKASSESGLCALTISRGTTEVIRGAAISSLHYRGRNPGRKQSGQKWKRAVTRREKTRKRTLASSDSRDGCALPSYLSEGPSGYPTVRHFLTTCSLSADEAALISV